MSRNKENKKLEMDALPIIENGALVRNSTNEIETFNGNNNNNAVINNNMLVNHQTNTATNLIFENCNNITMGNTISVNLPNTSSRSSSSVVMANEPEDKSLYIRTPTISEMMKSTQPLTEKYLDMFCENFGTRYQAVAVLLNVPDLFFQRMYADHFHRGTGEVIYQVLFQHFQENPDQATVGWFTKFLWKNGFRTTVYAAKEDYKKLRAMDNDDDDD